VIGDAYGLTHHVHELHGGVVLQPRGELNQPGAALLVRVLYGLLMDRGRVMLDVSGLTTSQIATLATLPSVLARAGGWPLARLVLVGANPTLTEALRLAGIDRALCLASDWDAATVLLRTRPQRLARENLMPAALEASTLARAAIREVCREWDLDAVSTNAEMITTELVANVVDHAATASTLTCTLADGDLQIAVRDQVPASDTGLQRITGRAGGRRGLHLVASIAHSWGCIRHHNGKTVWAVLKIKSPPQP
jgi:anti-sigma regulatory factor (Ser/Thr protein kinase)